MFRNILHLETQLFLVDFNSRNGFKIQLLCFILVCIILVSLYLLCGPERRLGLLVHLPDVVVLDGEDDKATRVLLQQRLLLLTAALLHNFGLKHKKNTLVHILHTIRAAINGLIAEIDY